MKKILALALALIMVLAFAACGAKAEDPAEEPVEEAPVVEADTGDASGEMGEASGEAAAPAEAGEASMEDDGPIDAFDLIVNAPVIGESAAEINAVGGDAGKVVVEPTWVGANGDEVFLDQGTFQEGEYTLSLAFWAADGYELTDPVNVKFVGATGTDSDYQAVSAEYDGATSYYMTNVMTLTAVEPTGEPEA